MSKSHLSKVQEQRITEADLAFDGMEPDCGAIMGFGSSTAGRMVSLPRRPLAGVAMSSALRRNTSFCLVFLQGDVNPCCVAW